MAVGFGHVLVTWVLVLVAAALVEYLFFGGGADLVDVLAGQLCFEFEAELARLEAVLKLTSQTGREVRTSAGSTGTPIQPLTTTGQVISAADQQRAQRAMKKGDEELEAGNVSAARLLYEFAADAGLAQAAMALAARRASRPVGGRGRRWWRRTCAFGNSW